MPDLEPITRDEMLWSGEDVEPITRREMYIRHLYDETQVIPEKPITREEMFILKAGEELHDVTIEQLNVTENGTYSEAGKAYSPVIVEVPETTLTTLDVTENGTYTAPSGTAYDEVDVNVPLPQNAYLLKSVTTPTPIASFSDGEEMVMPSLKVAIEPQQDLHGYDNPWVGGAGKNKAKPYSYTVTAPNGVTFTYNGDGSVTLNGTATASQAVPSVSVAVQNDLTFTLGSGTWIPSVSANNVTYEVYDTATSTLLSNGASFTLTEAKTVLFRVGAVNGQTYNNLKVYMQIESGSTASSFAPYSNICPIIGWTEAEVTVADDVDNPTVTHTTTIPFTDSQGNPIEAFGGECDVVSGSMLVTKANKVFNGEETWGYINGFFFANVLSPNGKNNTPSMTSNGINVAIVNNNQVRVYLEFNPSITADTDMNEIFNSGSQLVYELATPITIPLTPTSIKSLEGNNNVWGDCGNISEGSYFSKGEEE